MKIKIWHLLYGEMTVALKGSEAECKNIILHDAMNGVLPGLARILAREVDVPEPEWPGERRARDSMEHTTLALEHIGRVLKRLGDPDAVKDEHAELVGHLRIVRTYLLGGKPPGHPF